LYRFLDENRTLTNTSRRLTDETEDEKAMDITLGYRQTFDKKGQELTAYFVYNINVDDEISNFRETGDFTPEVQQTLVDDGNREIIAKADYVYPISDDSRFEAGFRSSFERLDEDSRFFDLNNESGQLEYNALQSNHFVFDQHIYSLYSNYSNKYKSISYQVGLRAEQTVTIADQRTQNIKDDNSYFSLFPTVFVTKDFNPDNKLQFSYSRRINRPRSRFLNPFVDRSDRFNIRFGNPNLKPEYVNSLELGYLRYWGKSSLNATFFYRHTLDEIERFRQPTTVIVDGEPVPGNEVTFLNVSDNRSYGAELGFNHPVSDWWRLNGSVSGFRTQLNTTQGDTELSAARLSWNAKMNSTMTVWKDLDIQISGFYRAPMADIQGRMEQMFSTDLAMKKDVL
ncbi:MAG: outer membrane beta-barrel family protein, partial [Pontibacter sp.]|nr:outer membrane beta-barrel family protein [Pontibacter sp.]